MEEQKIIINHYAQEFRKLWLEKELQHYIFNYMGWISARIISITLKSELSWINPEFTINDYEEAKSLVDSLALIYEKIQDEDFKKELKNRYNNWLIDSKELLNVLYDNLDWSMNFGKAS